MSQKKQRKSILSLFLGQWDFKGLLDCDDEDFDDEWEETKQAIIDLIDVKQAEKFINYFEEHKIDLVRSCMLKSVRVKANINRGTICSKRQSILQNWVMLHYCPLWNNSTHLRESVFYGKVGYGKTNSGWKVLSPQALNWPVQEHENNREGRYFERIEGWWSMVYSRQQTISVWKPRVHHKIQYKPLWWIERISSVHHQWKTFWKTRNGRWNFTCHEGKQRCYQLQGCEIGQRGIRVRRTYWYGTSLLRWW